MSAKPDYEYFGRTVTDILNESDNWCADTFEEIVRAAIFCNVPISDSSEGETQADEKEEIEQ